MSIRISGLEVPSVDEFLANPSLRTVSSFFVGWVFIVSLVYLAKSPAVRFLRRRVSAAITLAFPKPSKSLEQVEGNEGEENKLQSWLIETLMGDEDVDADPLNLVFVLTIFAAVGSLSMLGSLLTFRPPGRGDDALCAFVVAWGDMSAQSLRIAGLTRLSLDLRALSVRRWELYLMWAVLLGSLILMFVSNALSGGVLLPVQELRNTAICYRKHHVATSVVATVLNLVLEIYITARLITKLVPTFLQTKDKIHALLDIRIARSLSFLLMDLLTMVPHAKFVSIPADFIPFSISALIVLAAFNYNKARALSELSPTDSIPSTTLLNLGRSSTMGASRAPFSSSRRTTMRSIPPQVPRKTLSNGYIRYNSRLRQSLGMHPFSSASLQRGSTDMPDTAFYPPESALTWGSADAMSVQEARIELAFRNTRFDSVSTTRTPELILSPGSSLRATEGAIPRPNPTNREDLPAHSMYVDENGETHVHADEFPLPPPIFPLPPPRTTGVPPRTLRILTGTDSTSDTNQSAGGVTPQSVPRRRRNSTNSDWPTSGVPSAVYGSDIVSGSGSRNLLHNPSFSGGTLRSSTIGDDFADDFVDDYLEMLQRSALSSQFTTTPLPISAMSGKRSSSGRTFKMEESDNGLSVVEEEGGTSGAVVSSAVGGKRLSFAVRDKGKLKSVGKKVPRALSTRRSRRANSMDSSETPLRTAGSSAAREGGQWSTVPIMVVEPIPTSPVSAPVFPTGALSAGLLSPSFVSPVEGAMDRRTDRGTDRGVDRGNSRGTSSAVRGRTRTRLVPRGPRSPEQGSILSPEEGLPRAYWFSPESGPFAKQD